MIVESIFKSLTTAETSNRRKNHLTSADYDLNKVVLINWYDRVDEILHLPNDITEEGYNKALATAAESGFIDIVKLLVSYADILFGDDFNPDIDNALAGAAGFGYLNIVKYLYSIGANPRAFDSDVLKEALDGGHKDIVKYLIPLSDPAFVARINPDYLKESIHSMALLGKVVSIVESVNINEVDTNGYTPLMYAVLNGHEYTVMTLLENGADISIRNNAGQDAVEMARCIGDNDMIDILNNRLDESIFVPLTDEEKEQRLDMYDKMYNGKWFTNIIAMDDIAVEQMIIAGQDVNVKQSRPSTYVEMGDTALLFCVKRGFGGTEYTRMIMDLLIDNPNTNVNCRTYHHSMTPLMIAIKHRNTYAFNKLLERPDLDINARDIYQETALVKAVGIGSSRMVRELLEHRDINVNIPNDEGTTALDLALNMKRDIEAGDDNGSTLQYQNIIVMLKEHGAKATVRESINESIFVHPSSEEAEKRHSFMDKDYDLYNAVRYGRYNRVKDLLDNSTLEQNDIDGALVKSVDAGNMGIFELILQRIDNEEVLFKAAKEAILVGNIEMLAKLLTVVDAKMYDSELLSLAVQRGKYYMVKLLIPASDPSALDSRALRIAFEDDLYEIKKLLIPVSDKDDVEELLDMYSGRPEDDEFYYLHGHREDEPVNESIFVPPTETDLDNRMLYVPLDNYTWEHALVYGIYAVVRKYINIGQDINKLLNSGIPPIIQALANKNDPIVDLLLKNAKLDINVTDKMGNTPLMYAIGNSIPTLKKVLAYPGIDLNIGNNFGRTVFDMVEKNELVPEENKQLILSYKPGVKDNNIALKEAFEHRDETLIRQLIPVCNFKIVEELLDKYYVIKESIFKPLTDIEVTERIKDMQLKMSWKNAIINGSVTVVKWYLMDGQDVNERIGGGLIPAISMACEYNNIGVVAVLLNAPGLDINAIDRWGNTPIMSAMRFSPDFIVKKMLEFPDIDLTIKNYKGIDALKMADTSIEVPGNNSELILQHGGKPVNESIFVPPTETDIDKRIEHYELDPQETWETVIRYDNLAGIRKYISKGQDVNEKVGRRNEPPLLFAISVNSPDAVDYLLKQSKLKINDRDDYGNTALMFALWNNNYSAIKKILERPDVDIINKNVYGESPLTIVKLEKFDRYKDRILKYKETDIAGMQI